MRKSKAVGLVGAAAVGLSVYAAPTPAPALSGCRINVAVKNTGGALASVFNADKWYQFPDQTGVKVKGGVWRALSKGYWFMGQERVSVQAGETKADQYQAGLSCSAKRRYRIYYSCDGGKNQGSRFTAYYPSATGWTDGYDGTTVTVDLPMCQK
jgi:hypothetical protein